MDSLPPSTPPAEPSEPLHEKMVAAAFHVERDLLKKMRGAGGVLVAGEDWDDVPGRGIIVSISGQKKIADALQVPPGAPEAPPAPEVRDIVIRFLCANPRIVEGVPAEGESGRQYVRLNRGASDLYRPGQTLKGCVRLPAANTWEYHGLPPVRRLLF